VPAGLLAALTAGLMLAACQNGGGQAGFYNDQGIEALRQDHYEEARRDFAAAAERSPKDAAIWGNLGVALTRLERYQEALDAYAKAHDLDPGDSVTVAEMASIAYRLGRYAEAEAGFRDAIRLEPRAPEFHSSLALALQREGKADEARTELDSVLAKADKHGLVRYQEAKFLLLTGDTAGALATFERSLQTYPAGARDSVSDPDFEPLRDDPRYQDLVKDWWRPRDPGS
jgi:Flp pilus assembly protein TadD